MNLLDRLLGVRTPEEKIRENVERAVVGGPNPELSGPIGELIWSKSLDDENFSGETEFQENFHLLRNSLNNQVLEERTVSGSELAGFIYEVTVDYLHGLMDDQNQKILSMESESSPGPERRRKTRVYEQHLEEIELVFHNLEAVLYAYNHSQADEKARRIEEMISLLGEEEKILEKLAEESSGPDTSTAKQKNAEKSAGLMEKLFSSVKKENKVLNGL